MPKMKMGPKVLIAITFGFVLFQGAKIGMAKGYIPTPGVFKAKVIETDANIANAQDSRATSVVQLSLPSTKPADITGPELKFMGWAWNGHLGCLEAIGGPRTTRGSLMEKYHVNASFERNDDTDNGMKPALISYAKGYAAGNKNPEGVNMVTLMGSQLNGFFVSVNPLLAEVKDKAIAVAVCGRSDGEDAVMGPKEWKTDPKKMIGKAISVVILEGDADLLKKYLKDNKLPFNPDPTTYDADAVNIIAAKDFVDASDKFNANYCEDRAVVRNGVKTGKTQKVCADGVSTWTPADVKAAMGRGGIVRIVSTHEYTGLMPNVVVVLQHWAEDNRPTLVNALRAFGEAGDQVLAYPEALQRGCEISAQVYKEQNAAYWCKYYRGVTQADATNQQVQLGGSRVANLADNARWFGLNGGENIYCRTYTTFGKMGVELYPQTFSKVIPCEESSDFSYVKEAISQSQSTTQSEAETRKFSESTAGSRIAERSWNITFRTGSDELSPEATKVLEEMLNDLVISDNVFVEVNGHTDNVGNPQSNQDLSERRAAKVRQWLIKNSKGTLKQSQLHDQGFGDTQPVVDNDTPAGKAKNRRVDIVQRRNQ